MNTVLIATLILVSLGIFFAIILGIANKLFHVEEDPRIEQIEEVLSGANCGACGYAGCTAYAEAVVNAGAPIDLCTPGGEETLTGIQKILSVKTGGKKDKNIAFLLCQGDCDLAPKKADYSGVDTCSGVKLVGGGDKSCVYGCLGYGDCERVCPFDAIHIGDKDLPIVDPKKCTGCGLCVKACPQDVLILQSIKKEVLIRCKNQEAAKDVIKECKVGCISCSLCEKNCPIDGAITIENNLAIMHYEFCIDCGLCAVVCPKNTITDKRKEERKMPVINEKCVGCTLCVRVCPVDVIAGKVKEQHKIDEEKCIGCLKCYDVCKFHAIDLTEMRLKKIEYYKDKKYNKGKKEYVNR